MQNESPEYLVTKEEEDEYIDKIKYLGKDMSKTLEQYQKKLWLRTITWYILADNIKDKIRDFIEKKVKSLDITIIILAFLGVVTNSIQMNLYLKYTITKKDNRYSIDIVGKSSNLIEAFRFITSISTLIVIILVFFHYRIKKNFLIFKYEIPINSSMLSQNLTIPMIIEIIFLIVHTPPFFNDMVINYRYKDVNIEEDIPIYIDLFISAFILTRIYLLFKFYVNYSKWGGVFASMVCSECNAKGGFHFTYKAGIKERSFTFVIIIMGFTILIFGYALRNSEISFVRYVPEKYFQDWTSIINGFWFMTTNILLLGYGDFYPTTLLGRIITFCTCIWGIILEGILIKAIINHLKMDNKEEASYNEVEQYLESVNYKKTALKLIYQVYSTHKVLENIKLENNMKKGELKDELFKLRKLKFNRVIWKLKKALRAFSLMRKNKEKNEREISVQNLMTKINLEINDNTNYLLRNIQTQINALQENINQVQENQNKIQLFTGILEAMHNNLNNKVKERTKSNGQVPVIDDIKNNKMKYKEKSANKRSIESIDSEFKNPSNKNVIL
jgi:hypothetical protein